MPWAVTMHITECANGHNLPGAFVTDGVSTYYTDAYGNFVAYVYDDTLLGYGLNVGKVGFVTRYTVIYRSQSGTTQNFCLDAAPPSTGGGSTGGNGCFIVSATTGSPESAEVMRLNMLRDRIARTSEIATSLLDAIYSDYYSFSPGIADELALNPMIREQVLRVAVRPFIAWFELVEVLALQGGNDRAALEGAGEVLRACDESAPSGEVARLIRAILDGSPTPDAPEPFQYLGERLRSAVHLPYVRWAVFEPILIAWEAKAAESTPEELLALSSDWLAEAPLDQLPTPSATEQLDDELHRLTLGAFSDITLRRRIGSRLAGSWSESINQLRRHGFVGETDD
jgi:hypothetical protein